MVTPIKRGLPRGAVLVQEQRVETHPTAFRGNQLHPVGPPVGLDDVPEIPEHLQGCRLTSGVDVYVDVAVGSGLVPNEGINTPPTFEP